MLHTFLLSLIALVIYAGVAFALTRLAATKSRRVNIHELAWHRPVIWIGIIACTWQVAGAAVAVAAAVSSATTYLLAVYHMRNPWRPTEE